MTLPRYGRNGDWEKAVALLEEMQTDGIRPDAVTYGTIVAAVSGRRARSVRVGTPYRAVTDVMHSSFFVIMFPPCTICSNVDRLLKGLWMGTLGCLTLLQKCVIFLSVDRVVANALSSLYYQL